MYHAHVFPHTNFALKTIFYSQCQALHIMEIIKVFVYVRDACMLMMGSSGTSVLMFFTVVPLHNSGLNYYLMRSPLGHGERPRAFVIIVITVSGNQGPTCHLSSPLHHHHCRGDLQDTRMNVLSCSARVCVCR